MELMSIGEFARRSHLSPKALRLYHRVGLLAPAEVDTGSGYRRYRVDQLEQARLVASLRQLGVPLTEIAAIVHLGPQQAAERVRAFWNGAEVEHAVRRELVGMVVDHLKGARTVMIDVKTRQVPSRTVLCVKRTVEGLDGAWAFGKEFVALLREHRLPSLAGRAGATYCIWWGEVNDDSDGPLEWCRPVPEDRAEALVGELPQLTLRTEPAHDEAYVPLEPVAPTSAAQWQLVWESLRAWGLEHHVEPSDLGIRITYLATGVEGAGPDCDVAVPYR